MNHRRAIVFVLTVALLIAGGVLGTAGCGATFRRAYTRDELRTRLQKRFPVESPAIVRALAERPIYTLEPARSSKEARAREHLRRLWIENDRLMIEFVL